LVVSLLLCASAAVHVGATPASIVKAQMRTVIGIVE
jgi:hypothetical protein